DLAPGRDENTEATELSRKTRKFSEHEMTRNSHEMTRNDVCYLASYRARSRVISRSRLSFSVALRVIFRGLRVPSVILSFPYSPMSATHSISKRAFLGNWATATVERAGGAA